MMLSLVVVSSLGSAAFAPSLCFDSSVGALVDALVRFFVTSAAVSWPLFTDFLEAGTVTSLLAVFLVFGASSATRKLLLCVLSLSVAVTGATYFGVALLVV